MFNELKVDIENLSNSQQFRDEKPVLKNLLKIRWDFVYADAHGLAHFLDPRHLGKYLTATETTAIVRHINGDPEIKSNNEILRFHAYVQEGIDEDEH